MIKTTGTTIAGLLYEGGIILGSDTRATMQDAAGASTLIDPECYKMNRLTDKIYCCGAGSAADMKRLSRLVEVSIACKFDKEVPVICPVTMMKRAMYKYKQYLTCAFIIGGADSTGPQLYTIYTGGSSHSHQYCAMGSGLQPATGILEAGWKANLCEQDAVDLMVNAVTAGIKHDLGSGSNVDITLIRTSGDVCVYKPYKKVGQPLVKHIVNDVPLGTAKVLSTRIIPVEEKYYRGSKRYFDEAFDLQCGNESKAKRFK